MRTVRPHHRQVLAQNRQGERKGRGGNPYPNRRPRREAQNANAPAQANDTKVEEHIVFVADAGGAGGDIIYDDTEEYYNFENVASADGIDERLIFYDWLADSGATSHITHKRDAFTTYERIPEVPIAGVGGMKARAVGRGTVNVQSECDGTIYILELQDVLHVPENRNNLLSLG